MRKRWLVGTLVVLVLALLGRVATLAQKAASPSLVQDSVPANAKKSQPKGWRSAGDPQAKTGDEPAGLPQPPRAAELAVDDPMGAVESFLQRNQKEADDAIKALTQEAEALRSRLQKVEAALGRWQGVAQALDQQARPGANGEATKVEAAPKPTSEERPPPPPLPGDPPSLLPLAKDRAEPTLPPELTPTTLPSPEPGLPTTPNPSTIPIPPPR